MKKVNNTVFLDITKMMKSVALDANELKFDKDDSIHFIKFIVVNTGAVVSIELKDKNNIADAGIWYDYYKRIKFKKNALSKLNDVFDKFVEVNNLSYNEKLRVIVLYNDYKVKNRNEIDLKSFSR